MKRLLLLLIIPFLVFTSCDFLISEAPNERENVNDPYWDPYSVFDQTIPGSGSLTSQVNAAMSGDYLVIGAPAAEVSGIVEAGEVYVYYRSNGSFSLVDTLQAPVLSTDMAFGYSVAIDGSTIAVGAAKEDIAPNNYAGAVYIFNKGSGADWSFTEKIESENPTVANEMFGSKVILDVPYLMVSAYQNAPSMQGSVYIYKFEFDDYAYKQTLTDSSPVNNARFGNSLAYSDPWLIVGCPQDTIPTTKQGSASIFERSGDAFTLSQKVVSGNPEEDGWFGYSVAVDQNKAAVSSLETVDSNSQAGRVYIFNRNGATWASTPSATLKSDNPQSPGGYGLGLSLLDDVLVIGAPYEGSSAAGKASLYEASGSNWTLSHEYEEGGTVNFGWSMFINNENLLICDLGNEGTNTGGRVYIYSSN